MGGRGRRIAIRRDLRPLCGANDLRPKRKSFCSHPAGKNWINGFMDFWMNEMSQSSIYPTIQQSSNPFQNAAGRPRLFV
jgi:hypothetical protein